MLMQFDQIESMEDLQSYMMEQEKNYLNFDTARGKIDKLIQDWDKEDKATQKRRRQRFLDINIQALQEKNKLKADETIISRREIDSNIRRELPPFLSYLKQSRRLAVFETQGNNPEIQLDKITQLETEFTKGMTYPDWEMPLFKSLDGSATHGWDSIEVEFDESKPLHVNIDHIGHENLIFPLDAKDIQNCELLLRKYELTKNKLLSFIQKFGFDIKEGLNLIRDNENKKETSILVYKVFFKFNGIVYTAWYAGAKTSGTWLRAPIALNMGRKLKEDKLTVVTDPITGAPTPTTQATWTTVTENLYPIFILPYDETEQQCISAHKGRCFLDGPRQEALTALTSIYVNGAVRAGNVYASPAGTSPEDQNPIAKVDVNLEHAAVYNRALQFWAPPYPPDGLLRAVDSINSQGKEEAGQITYSALNREDSRKTATEISAATQQQQLLTSVDVIMFSTFLRKVFNYCWLIIQSQALQGLVDFMQISLMGPMGTKTVKIPDEATLSIPFLLKAAGDVDVIQREEKLQKRISFWQIIAATPLAAPIAPKFFLDMLTEAFPEDVESYKEAIQKYVMAQQQQAMMGGGMPPGPMDQQPPTQGQGAPPVADAGANPADMQAPHMPSGNVVPLH
jgi:hypothetical protein